MARLEALLDLAILATCREPDEAEELLRGRKTLSAPGRHHRVVVWARPGIRARWERACRAVRRRDGRLPDWAAAVVVSWEALDQWTHLDPGRLPTERRTLERDGWRCRVPGCGARRNLEVHHIVFRSRGGSNASWNLVTLCHAHHHHALHRGTLRVTGRAPCALDLGDRLFPGCRAALDLPWRTARAPSGQGRIAHAARANSSPRSVSPPPGSPTGPRDVGFCHSGDPKSESEARPAIPDRIPSPKPDPNPNPARPEPNREESPYRCALRSPTFRSCRFRLRASGRPAVGRHAPCRPGPDPEHPPGVQGERAGVERDHGRFLQRHRRKHRGSLPRRERPGSVPGRPGTVPTSSPAAPGRHPAARPSRSRARLTCATTTG